MYLKTSNLNVQNHNQRTNIDNPIFLKVKNCGIIGYYFKGYAFKDRQL